MVEKGIYDGEGNQSAIEHDITASYFFVWCPWDAHYLVILFDKGAIHIHICPGNQTVFQ